MKDNTSTANIDTIAEADSKTGSDLIQDWMIGITSKSVTGLTTSSNYHFAVLVRDTAGNKALYAPATGTPNIICGNGFLETGEGCDDGNTANGDGCSSVCMP